jgi:hypothetical protein
MQPSFMPKRWRRSPLFGTYVGDIALIGRIFKIVGTPEVASWPVRCRAAIPLVYN